MTHYARISALGLAATLALAGCSSGSAVDTAASSPSTTKATSSPGAAKPQGKPEAKAEVQAKPEAKSTVTVTANGFTSTQVVAAPKPTVRKTVPPPAPAPKTDPRFATCKAAKAAGYGPYDRGVDPEYAWYQDRDHDGVVCE